MTLAYHGCHINAGKLAEDLRIGASRFNDYYFGGHTGFIYREMLGSHTDGHVAPFGNIRGQWQRQMDAAANRYSEVSAISRKAVRFPSRKKFIMAVTARSGR